MRKQLIKPLVLVLSVIFFSACQSDKDESSQNNGGEDSEDNQQEQGAVSDFALTLSRVAIETSKSSVGSQNGLLPVGGPSAQGQGLMKPTSIRNIDSIMMKSQLGTQALSLAPENVDITVEPGDCGGEVELIVTTTTPNDSNDPFPFSIVGEGEYRDFCIDSGNGTAVFNGELVFRSEFTNINNYVTSFSYDIRYTSTVPFYPSGRLVASESCSVVNGGLEMCTYETGYRDMSGTRYAFSDYEISGNNSSGYNFGGTITDEMDNTYTLSVNNLSFCDDGNVATGMLEVTVNGTDVITVTVLSCDEYMVTYRGVSEVISQN